MKNKKDNQLQKTDNHVVPEGHEAVWVSDGHVDNDKFEVTRRYIIYRPIQHKINLK